MGFTSSNSVQRDGHHFRAVWERWSRLWTTAARHLLSVHVGSDIVPLHGFNAASWCRCVLLSAVVGEVCCTENKHWARSWALQIAKSDNLRAHEKYSSEECWHLWLASNRITSIAWGLLYHCPKPMLGYVPTVLPLFYQCLGKGAVYIGNPALDPSAAFRRHMLPPE